ncbi:MAG: hypothetical protein U0R50_04175 [Gaiellales bacterium]
MPPRRTSEASAELLRATWADERIVTGARCLGTGGPPGSTGGWTQFACEIAYTKRPAKVPRDRWNQLGGAMRARDVPLALSILGVSVTATESEMTAASAAWGLDGSRAQTEVVGLSFDSATRWAIVASPVAAGDFESAAAAFSDLLATVPAVEAFRADHGTYTGMTLDGLRTIEATISPYVEIRRADDTGYCVQVSAGSLIWSQAGPNGVATLRACPA